MTVDNYIHQARLVHEKNWVKAVHILKMGIEQYPQEPSLHITLANIYGLKNQHKEALKHQLKAMALDQGNPDILFSIGMSYLLIYEHRLALAYFKRIPDPSDEVLYNIGYLQAALGQNQESIQTMTQLLKRVPAYPYIYLLIVEQLFGQGKFDEAMEYLKEAEAKLGKNPQLLILSASYYASRSMWLHAYHHYSESAALAPIINPEAMMQYAQAAMNLGLNDKALEILLTCEKKWPYIGEIYTNLVRLYLYLGRTQEAKEVTERAESKLSRMNPALRFLKERLNRELS